MMLHADEFQRFEARVGARTVWSLPPPPDRFLATAPKKKFGQNCASRNLRVLVVRDEARHSRRARGDARAGWRRIKPRRSPGRRRRSPDTILDGSGYACAPSLVSASFLARFQENHPLTVNPLLSSTQAVESGVWDRPADALPDASDWPTWGALRERILMNAKEVRRASPGPARLPNPRRLPIPIRALRSQTPDVALLFALSLPRTDHRFASRTRKPCTTPSPRR
jgi:hypothetical protein